MNKLFLGIIAVVVVAVAALMLVFTQAPAAGFTGGGAATSVIDDTTTDIPDTPSTPDVPSDPVRAMNIACNENSLTIYNDGNVPIELDYNSVRDVKNIVSHVETETTIQPGDVALVPLRVEIGSADGRSPYRLMFLEVNDRGGTDYISYDFIC